MTIYYFVYLYHYFDIRHDIPTVYDIFTDIVWYPLYEETAYRAFFLSHYAQLNVSSSSKRNLTVNLLQSILFLSIHKHHIVSGVYLVLVPVFLLGFMNGIIFQKTRNIYGCLIAHSVLNAFALILRLV